MAPDESTKSRILNAAGPIFSQKGFRDSTVREICDSANVNLASINYYFGDKQQLYKQTVFLARQMRADHAPLPDWGKETPAQQKLQAFVQLILKRMVAIESETVPWQIHLLMREILNPTEACKTMVEEYFRPMFEVLLSIIDELSERKLPEIKQRQIGFSIIGQCLHYRFSSGIMSLLLSDSQYKQHLNLEQLTHHITEFSIGAIANVGLDVDLERPFETIGHPKK